MLWRLEVVSGLNAGIRRGRIDADYRDEALAALSLHDIKMDPETWENAWSATLRLADRFGLTPYDAAYIEVAQRRSLPLAALDADMCAAADALGLGLA